MKARFIAWAAASLLVLLPGGGVAARESTAPQESKARGHQDDRRQSPRRVKWWMHAKERAELGITDEQSAKIEAIWQATLPSQRERWREFERLEDELNRLVKEARVDATVIAQKVERVENLRAELNKTRIIMFYRMHAELTPEQRAKLKALDERQEAERRKSSDARARR